MLDIVQFTKEEFPFLQEKHVEQLIGMSTPKTLAANEVFTGMGDRSPRIAVIMSGIFRVFYIDDKGDELTVGFRSEGEFIGAYEPLMSNKPSRQTIQALEESLVFVVDFRKYKELAERDLAFARMYTKVLEGIVLELIERSDNMTINNPEQRYRNLLAHDKESAYLNRVPQKYVASYLGITPVSLSRLKKRVYEKR